MSVGIVGVLTECPPSLQASRLRPAPPLCPKPFLVGWPSRLTRDSQTLSGEGV